MNKRDKKLWALGIVIITISVVVIAYKILSIKIVRYDEPIKDHHDLFAAGAQGLLQFVGAAKVDKGLPASDYIYDKKYTISIYQARLTANLNLKSIISFESRPSQRIDGFYVSGGGPNFTIQYGERGNDNLSRLIIRYQGTYINKYFEGDSVCYAHMNFDNYSISYDDNCILRANTTIGTGTSPASILVLKRGKMLYILNLTIYNGPSDMPEKKLYELIKK